MMRTRMDIVDAHRMREDGYKESTISGYYEATHTAYDVCQSCGMTDAPGAFTCMNCYVRGLPHRMITVRAS